MLEQSSSLRLRDHSPLADAGRMLQIAALVLAAHIALVLLLVWTRPDVITPPRPVPIQISLLSAGAATAVTQRAPAPKTDTSRPSPPAAPPHAEPRPAVSASPPLAAAPVPEPPTDTASAASASTALPPARAPVASSASPAPAAPPAQESVDRMPSVDASFRGNRVPDYPLMSRRLGEQGVVVLRVLISTEGRAVEVRLMRSSGSDRLDRSAMDAIREWRFIPATRGGKPEPAWYEWRWEFRLSG